MMTINERFETIIQILCNGNKRAFAKTVGISPTVVENIVGTRKGKPSYDVLVKVCSNANISAEWLLLGLGDKFADVFEFRKTLHISSKDVPDSDFEAENREYERELAEQTANLESALVSHLKEDIKIKSVEIRELYEEIGRLKERIAQLEREKNVSGGSYQSVPQRETVDSL